MQPVFRLSGAASAQAVEGQAATVAARHTPVNGSVRHIVGLARGRAPKATVIRLLAVGALAAAGLVAVEIGASSANVTQLPSHGGKAVSFAAGGNPGSLFDFLTTRFAAAVGPADLSNGQPMPHLNNPLG